MIKSLRNRGLHVNAGVIDADGIRYPVSSDVSKEIPSFTNVSSSGPILVAWQEPFPRGVNGADTLVLDMSDFSENDVDRAFGIWMERIVQDPSVWNDGFKLVLAREAFRNFIQKYGESIMEVIKSTRDIIG